MAHEHHFDPDDPVLARLRDVALALPGADEKVSHGRPAFFTKKIFAIFGAVVKGETDSDRFAQSLLFFPDPDEAEALAQHPLVFVPAYWGPWGWLSYDLASPDADWGEVAELVEDSFRLTAPKKLAADFEARG